LEVKLRLNMIPFAMPIILQYVLNPIYEAREIFFQLKNDKILLQPITCGIKEQPNIPHCPTCGSTNIKSITATERATSIIGLEIFSKKINKTYKCLNFKYKW